MRIKKKYKTIGILVIVVVAIIIGYLNFMGQPFVVAVRESQVRVGDPIHWAISGISCTQPKSGSICNEVKTIVSMCPAIGNTQCGTITTKTWQNAKYNMKLDSSEGAYTIPNNLQVGSYNIMEFIYNDGVKIKETRWKTIEVLGASANTCETDPSLVQPYSSCDKAWCAGGSVQHTWAVNRYCAVDLCGNGKQDIDRGETAELCPKDFAIIEPLNEQKCPLGVLPTCESGFEIVNNIDVDGCAISSCMLKFIDPSLKKDSDDDGITDAIDACPDKKGLAQLNGCPEETKQEKGFWEIHGLYVIISIIVGIVTWGLILMYYSLSKRRN